MGSGSKFVAKGSAAEVTVQPILAFETDEERAEYEAASVKTNEELADMVETSMKYGG